MSAGAYRIIVFYEVFADIRYDAHMAFVFYYSVGLDTLYIMDTAE